MTSYGSSAEATNGSEEEVMKGLAAIMVAICCTASAQTSTLRHRPSQPRPAVGEIVFMAPVKANSLGPRGSELVTMNLDGSDRRQITDNDRQEFLPHFSPDGNRLVYTVFVTGSYGQPGAQTAVGVFDLKRDVETILTSSGTDVDPVWSPDGSRIAFLSARDFRFGLWIMNADGSQAHRIATPSGAPDDQVWGDIAWSRGDWIMFVVAHNVGGCFKVRIDKIRPDGSDRTQVTDGGPNCTPPGMEQSGYADPGFSADGLTIYSSRGFPRAPAGAPAAQMLTERKLFAFSSGGWYPGKPEIDLSLPSEPSCIEGVPKGSLDGTRILLFRACFDQPNFRNGIYVTDTAGSYRQWVADGFGPDWNPTR